jgi:NAD(P)-dependent dehydrogenase (short-subunit alcohol dehydrogenase family)
MAGRLEGKVVVVVGGATGFGRACTERFAREGATVVVAGRRGDVAAEVAASHGGMGIGWDVCDFDQGAAAAAAVMERYGRLDAAINFAGYDASCPIAKITPEHLEPMVAVQFTGAIYFLRHMANAMVDSGGGSVILCSSLTAHAPSVGRAGYAGAKAGLEYVARIASVEYGRQQVRVNCISPHMIETEMTSPLFARPFVVETVRLQTPLKRMGHADDIANAALFLASDEANYITGQTLCVDGGTSNQKLPADVDYGLLGLARPELAADDARSGLPAWFSAENDWGRPSGR